MKKTIKIILIMLVYLIVTAGCWDMEDIEDYNILTTVIVDKTEEGFAFYVEIAPIGATQQGQEDKQANTQTIIMKGEGKTLAEARKNLNRKSNKTLFLGAISCLIFTEKMAKYSIEEYLYRLREDPQYRKTLSVYILKDDPMKLLNSQAENNSLIGMAIEECMQSLVKIGFSVDISVLEILEGLVCPNNSYIIPVVATKENTITIDGYSIFNQGKEIGFIPLLEAEGLIILIGDKYQSVQTITYHDTTFTIDLKRKKKKYRVSINHNTIVYDIDISFESRILYPDKKISITEDKIYQINQILINQMKNIIENEIKKAVYIYNTDYLKFYDTFRIKYPQQCKNNNWREIFPTIKYNVKVNSKIEVSNKIDYDNNEGR